jgi:hypothetical protein
MRSSGRRRRGTRWGPIPRRGLGRIGRRRRPPVRTVMVAGVCVGLGVRTFAGVAVPVDRRRPPEDDPQRGAQEHGVPILHVRVATDRDQLHRVQDGEDCVDYRRGDVRCAVDGRIASLVVGRQRLHEQPGAPPGSQSQRAGQDDDRDRLFQGLFRLTLCDLPCAPGLPRRGRGHRPRSTPQATMSRPAVLVMAFNVASTHPVERSANWSPVPRSQFTIPEKS